MLLLILENDLFSILLVAWIFNVFIGSPLRAIEPRNLAPWRLCMFSLPQLCHFVVAQTGLGWFAFFKHNAQKCACDFPGDMISFVYF